MIEDDKKMVDAFRCLEPGGFDRLYQEYGNRIYRFCRRLSGSDADAEDLTQEVFLAAFRGAGKFEGRSSLSTWLYRIAVYSFRQQGCSRKFDMVPLDETLAAPHSDPAVRSLERITLERALDQLTPNLREAFLLVKAEGLLFREASYVLGIPEGTLKSRVQAAIAQLHRLLEPAEDEVATLPPLVQKHPKESCHEL